jgi:hypothetical protein
MSFPEHENNSKFYKDSGLEGRRKKNPYLAQEDLPEDVETREFKEKVSAARQAHASLRLRGKKAAGGPPWEAGEGGGAGGIQISDDPAIVSLILGEYLSSFLLCHRSCGVRVSVLTVCLSVIRTHT